MSSDQSHAGVVSPRFPASTSTQVITLASRQRRMRDFFTIPGQMYLALGKSSAWKDSENPSISDTTPPIPNGNQTFINELIGVQRITWKKYCKPIINPTTAEKNQSVEPVYNSGRAVVGYTDGYVEYGGVYYFCTSDYDLAIESGCTGVMIYTLIEGDDTFQYGVTFRQSGLYVNSTETARYIGSQQWNNLSDERKGTLELICNWPPHTRYQSANEEIWCLMSF